MDGLISLLLKMRNARKIVVKEMGFIIRMGVLFRIECMIWQEVMLRKWQVFYFRIEFIYILLILGQL